MKNLWLSAIAVGVLTVGAATGHAAELRAELRAATPTGPGDALGTVTVADSPQGALFTTALRGLPPGSHGFHVHENGSCDASTVNGGPVSAGAAGGHLDPQQTKRHEGPEGHGHLGDLPALQVAPDGSADQKLAGPQIKDAAVLRGKAVVIHAGADNYSDQPAPLGGGGARIACGILQ